MHFIKYLQSDIFIALLKKCACLVGNSSAGIKECSFLGIPAVNIGDRQEGRLRGPNVTDAGYKAAEIQKAIEKQVRKGKYPASDIYFKKDCIKRITGTLASAPLYAQKKFYNL
jgi:UDP-N-acetylglucosamine 2-epimerase